MHCPACGSFTLVDDRCRTCGHEPGSGLPVLVLVGFLVIPLLIPIYPLLGVLGTAAMLGANWLAPLLGAGKGVRLLAIALAGYGTLFAVFPLERRASSSKGYRTARKVLRIAVCAGLVILGFGIGVNVPEAGNGPLFMIIGPPLVYFLAGKFDRALKLGGPLPVVGAQTASTEERALFFWNRPREGSAEPRALKSSGFKSRFVREDLDGQRVGFAVFPGRRPRKLLAFVLAIGFAIAVILVADPESSYPVQALWIAGAIIGAWLVFRYTKRWTATTASKDAGGQFVASPAGIELPDGKLINRDDVARLILQVRDNGRTLPVSNTVCVRVKGGRPRDWARGIAGGMDRETAMALLVTASAAIGVDHAAEE